MAAKVKRVIWAVNPFAKDKALQLSTFKALTKLIKGSQVTIEPVAVLSPDQLKVSKEVFHGQSKAYGTQAESLLKSWVKACKDPRVTSPTLLVQDVYSTHITLDVLLRYARENQADLIAVGTHNRKGLQRFFLGSFAETLLLKSEIPVLVVNPKSASSKNINKVLFATDFSTASLEAFKSLLPVVGTIKGKVTLYFKFDYITADTQEVLGVAFDYKQYFKQDLVAKQNTAKRWVELAQNAGVRADFILDDKGVYVSEGILKAAKKVKAGLIAMASNSGEFSAALIGSVCRQVVRTATVPVWIIHTEKKEADAKAEKGGPRARLLTATGGTL